MKSCDHSQWLALGSQDGDIDFQETNRLQTLVEGLPSPDTRYPGLLVLIGKKTKALFLSELVSVERKHKFRVRQARRGIHLHLDASSVFHENPIFYADSYLPIRLVGDSTSPSEQCHESFKRSLSPDLGEFLGLTRTEAADYLHARLLRPFSDVFCLFLADSGGMQPVVECLVSWLEKGQTVTVPEATNPTLLIVVENEAPGRKVESEVKEELLRLLAQMTPRSILDIFLGVSVVSIYPEGKLSLQARCRRLKERLMDTMDQALSRRLQVGMCFSATHFAVFFKHACDHFVTHPKEPFNFIKTSRLRNPVSSEMDQNLSRFLKHIRSPQELASFAIPIIASSFVLNAYPPEMHDFKPRDVFQELYMNSCRRVGRIGMSGLNGSAYLLLPSAFVKLVEHEFVRYYNKSLGTTSAAIHLENLQRFRSHWQTIRDRDVCLVCLDQTPQYTLPCAHTDCDLCVQRYWKRDHHPWVFKLDECILCRSNFRQQVTVKLRDPSRGFRVLSLDGGGIRGMVHLKFLQALENRIGLPNLPVQENFDFTIGTSCGVIINLAMFVRGLSVDDSIRAFEELAREAFKPRRVSGIPVISDIEKIVFSVLADSLYPPEGLEAGLKQVFGETMTMFDCSYATTIGVKVAATATTVLESHPCLFSNYEKVNKQRKDLGYHIIRPQDGNGDPLVWQVARCASAAPGYFPPFDIPGVGSLEDGGVWKNNPVGVVNPEIEALAPLTEEILIVSVGTGSSEEKDRPDLSAPRRGWKDCAFVRNCRAYMQSMSGKRQGQDFSNQRRLAPREDYYRFDVKWDGKEPGLDQFCQMPLVKAKAEEQFSDSKEMDILAYRILASYFHFEFEAEPKKRDGQHVGAGHILCDLKHNHPAYRALRNRLSRGKARFYVDGGRIPGKVGDRLSVDRDGDFRKRVEFKSVTGTLSISLEISGRGPYDISGSPFSIERRVTAQNLDAYFGQASHRKRKRLDQGNLDAKQRRRMV